MRKRIICLIVALMIGGSLTCPALAASTFPDVDENAVYADAVEFVNKADFMHGNRGNFNPDQNVTRAQMAAIICRMLGETENLKTDGTRFSDVSSSYWANAYIAKAADLKIISGYPDGSFRPDNTVTYEQALKMVLNANGLAEFAAEHGGYPDGYIWVANDYGYANQVAGEKGTYLKRWQVAVLIYNSMA